MKGIQEIKAIGTWQKKKATGKVQPSLASKGYMYVDVIRVMWSY